MRSQTEESYPCCATDANGTGTPLFHKLDTTAGVITDLGTLQSTGGNDVYDRVLLSPDGSKVYFRVAGDSSASFWLETANDQMTFSNSPAPNWDALVVASGQNNLAIIANVGVSFVDLSTLPVAAAFALSSAEDRCTPQNVAGAQTLKHPSNLSIRRPKLKHRLDNSNITVRKP